MSTGKKIMMTFRVTEKEIKFVQKYCELNNSNQTDVFGNLFACLQENCQGKKYPIPYRIYRSAYPFDILLYIIIFLGKHSPTLK